MGVGTDERAVHACDNCGDTEAKLYIWRRRRVCHPCMDATLAKEKLDAQYVLGAVEERKEDQWNKEYVKMGDRVSASMAEIEKLKKANADLRNENSKLRLEMKKPKEGKGDGWIHVPSITKLEAVALKAELDKLIHPKEG